MDSIDTPEELHSEPERRLVGTRITRGPRKSSRAFSVSFLLLVVLMTQIYWFNLWDLADQLPAVQRDIFARHQAWRAFTAIFIHADTGHLLSNLYMLGILSFFVYGYYGPKVYPLLLILVAALVNVLSVSTYPPETRLLGASGLVYVLGGFWLATYLFVQRQYSFGQRLLRVLGIALMIFFPTSFEATTSYRTHFIGFLAGLLVGMLYFFINRKQIRSEEEYQIVV